MSFSYKLAIPGPMYEHLYLMRENPDQSLKVVIGEALLAAARDERIRRRAIEIAMERSRVRGS